LPNQKPYEIAPNGLRVHIRLQSKASINAIDGIAQNDAGRRCLRVRVTAVPEKSKANKALLKLLAKTWHAPVSDLELVAGGKARDKTVHWAGKAEELTTRFEAALR
jgi:uncharacterized protein (TIGR00251 family)